MHWPNVLIRRVHFNSFILLRYNFAQDKQDAHEKSFHVNLGRLFSQTTLSII